MTGSKPAFPRLLYVGDIPVEASYHGSALLYRLLEDWPADRLAIFETGTSKASLPERRLPRVAYRYIPPPGMRLQTTRFTKTYMRLIASLASIRALGLAAKARHFAPSSILTVTHGQSFLVAAHLARRLNIPLHLICHDDWVWTVGGEERQSRRYATLFAKHYRAAVSRLCVSPGMAALYEELTGAPGIVLYPSRARNAVCHDAPPARLGEAREGFRIAFAGSISKSASGKRLAELAAQLTVQGGELHLFGPIDFAAMVAHGLDLPNVRLHGLIPSAVLIDRLRAEIDALYVPMSFFADDAFDVEIGFPSKLTDYTATGLPMLIHAPATSSAARWASGHPGVAELVCDSAPEALAGAIHRLATDPAHRMALGTRALSVGEATFSFEPINRIFQAAIIGRATATR